MTFAEFDEATPRMVQLFISSYGERSEERQHQLIVAAYHEVGFACAAENVDGGGLTPEHLRRALYGEEPEGKDYDAEFDRRASAMGAFFGRIYGRSVAPVAQEQP